MKKYIYNPFDEALLFIFACYSRQLFLKNDNLENRKMHFLKIPYKFKYLKECIKLP